MILIDTILQSSLGMIQVSDNYMVPHSLTKTESFSAKFTYKIIEILPIEDNSNFDA